MPVEEYIIFTAGPAKALCGDQPDVHAPLYTESLSLLREGVKALGAYEKPFTKLCVNLVAGRMRHWAQSLETYRRHA